MQVAGIEAADWFLIGVLLVIAYPVAVLAVHLRHAVLIFVFAPALVLALAVGGFLVWLVLFYDDPLDPGFSEGTARQLVAQELCPRDPDSAKAALESYEDSGYYVVYMPALNGRLATFSVGKGLDDQPRVDAEGPRSEYFLALSQNSPGC